VTAPVVPSEPTEPTVDVQATGTAAPVVTTAPTEVQEMRINTEFLEEFGMTLSELEEKHGNAVRGEVDDSLSQNEMLFRTTYTYFFEGDNRGYTFWVEGENANEVNKQRSQADGVSRLNDTCSQGERIEFHWFSGQAKDIFLGFEEPMSFVEFKKVYDIDTDGSSFLVVWNGFDYGFNVRELIDSQADNGIISPESIISVRFYPYGFGGN
jgi:hypothetical protein